MARRDLSRTVIEGGRRRYSKFQRHADNAGVRVAERAWLTSVREDEDVADYSSLARVIKRNRHFYDKLAVPRRWLRKQAGRRWDDVFSDLMSRFDPRTTAGRHIVFDHMLRDVRGVLGVDAWRTYELVIDDDGILRTQPSWRELHKKVKPPPWTDGNSALQIGKRWWWVGNRPIEPCVHVAKCSLDHIVVDGVWRHYSRNTRIRPLTPTEVGRLTSLPPRVREVVLWRAKG
jgi:hypothetical protein